MALDADRLTIRHKDEFRDFVTVVHDHLNRGPDRKAFTYLVDGEDACQYLTYADLDRRARAIAGHLQSRGLSGQKALLLFPPGLEFVAALFGCFYANVVAIPAFPPRKNRNMLRLKAIAQDAHANVALTASAVTGRIERLLGFALHLDQIQWIATDSIPDDDAGAWQRHEFSPEELAILQYTSGSTGKPKGVMLSHANLDANCKLITTAFNPIENEPAVTWLPTYHDMGLVGGVLEPIYTGTPVVMMSPMAFLQKPVRWLQAITKHNATISGGPNFAYDLCTKKVTDQQRAELDLSSWRIAFNGAEPVRASTLENFAARFAAVGFRKEAFHPCYGMAETTLMVTGGLAEELPIRKTFDAKQLDAGRVEPTGPSASARPLIGCGIEFPHHDVLIVEPDSHQILPSNRIGEIWVSGPSVGKGYLGRPAETEATFGATLAARPDQKFLRTGDLGFIHDGQLFVNGRIKDLIIVRGVNRYPQDIEISVEASDARIRTGCAAAFAIERDGQEQLVIVAEAERLARQNWDALLGKVRDSVAQAHDIAPAAVVLVRTGSIPKTSSGKIQRHACRDGFLNNTLLEVASWHADAPVVVAQMANPSQQATDVLDVVYAAVRAVARERIGEIKPDTNVVELGLDSLERVEIANGIETALEITFSDEELMRVETCAEIAAVAQQKKDAQQSSHSREITAADYQFDKMPEYLQLLRTRQAFAAYDVDSPYFGVHEGTCRATTVIEGREFVNFSSYNYLGMSGDPEVVRAAQNAIQRYGTSVSASRLVSGERPIHGRLESQIANLLGVDDAIVYVGGHSTNETTIGHLFGPHDLILHDALAHNSIIQGALLSGADRRPFAHNDWDDLSGQLATLRDQYRRVLVVIEGAYSMDGDYPDLPRFIEVAKQHKTLLMVDEAHSMGTMGSHGRGISEHFGVDPATVDIWMGTLSKSFGSCGGYIAGSRALVDYLRHTAPGFVYSVGLSPPNAAAASAAIQKMLRTPDRVRRCQQRSREFLDAARAHGLDTGGSKDTPVIPVILGSSKLALELSHRLGIRGINVQPIMHPAVEDSAARLRFFITSEHTTTQILMAVKVTAEELAKIQGRAAGKFIPKTHLLRDSRNVTDPINDLPTKRAI